MRRAKLLQEIQKMQFEKVSVFVKGCVKRYSINFTGSLFARRYILMWNPCF